MLAPITLPAEEILCWAAGTRLERAHCTLHSFTLVFPFFSFLLIKPFLQNAEHAAKSAKIHVSERLKLQNVLCPQPCLADGWDKDKEVSRSYLNVSFFFALPIFESWFGGPVM